MLLDMISHAKIDIREIFVSEITEQYLASMAQIDELDMESASEFLQMAATLLEIKSRALLPKPPKEPEEGEETPEDALIRQLTEYKQFKELSAELKKLEDDARALITKLPEEYPLPPPTIELTGLTLSGLAKAFSRVLKRLEALSENEMVEKFSHREVRNDAYTVAQCAVRILKMLRRGPVSFYDLFDARALRDEVISVFLALLELLKTGRARAKQAGEYSDIVIESAKSQQ